MRILILANDDAGLYKFRGELIQQLLKAHEVYISLPYGDFIPRLQEMGCNYIDTPVDRRGVNPSNDIKLIMKYISIVGHVKPAVVLTYTIKPNIYGGLVCRICKVPYMSNITGLGSAVEQGSIMRTIILFLYRLALRDSRCIFFQNKGNLSFFEEKNILKGQKYRLIPGSGVNLEHFRLLEYPNDDVINLLFIGRLMKEKGIEQYMDAAEYLSSKYDNIAFHILGASEEDYENRLKALQEIKAVQYHGMQEDVRVFQKISHCTIHPSYYPEGMSNVLLESAACGRPVITTNRSGCKEIVDEGINGYFVEQRSSKDLIKKIEQFMELKNEERKEMGLAGRAKVEREFDRHIVINAYLDEIQNIRK